MEYASVIWDPYTKASLDKLEWIQRQAARWTYSEYSPKTSVTDLLGKLQWEPLQERRRIQRLVFLYKLLNGKAAVPADTVDLVLNPRPTWGTSPNQQRLAIQCARTVEFKNSFSLWTVPDWNKVSQTIAVSAESVASFRTRLTGQVPKAPNPCWCDAPVWGPWQLLIQIQIQKAYSEVVAYFLENPWKRLNTHKISSVHRSDYR